MVDFLPPPEGLSLDEIQTDAGLLAAIKREAAKLDAAREQGRKLSRDEIRLVSFLAGEVKRRIAHLTPSQQEELDRIREQAHQRDSEARVQEVANDVETFVQSVDDPETEFRFSRISELENEVAGVMHDLEVDPDRYGDLLGQLSEQMERLETIKQRGKYYGGLPEL